MANRRIGADDGTVLFACSLCGIPARYPTEMRYTAERFFYCFRHSDTTTNLEEAMKQGRGARYTDESSPRFPVGVAALWQLPGDDDVTAGGTVSGTAGTVTRSMGSMTASRTATGTYVVTIPSSLARNGLVTVLTPRDVPGAIPAIWTTQTVSAQSVRVFTWNRLGTLIDTDFDIAMWAV